MSLLCKVILVRQIVLYCHMRNIHKTEQSSGCTVLIRLPQHRSAVSFLFIISLST